MQGVTEKVGLNNSELLSLKGVWLIVGLYGKGSGWFVGESQVGTWARLEVVVGLISGERLQLTHFKLSIGACMALPRGTA